MKTVRVTRNGLVILVCVSAGQREKALRVKQMGAINVNCFALKKRAPLKGVITGVAVNVKVDQLKGKIPGVCDARCLGQRRQGGMGGETESLSVVVCVNFRGAHGVGDQKCPVRERQVEVSRAGVVWKLSSLRQ